MLLGSHASSMGSAARPASVTSPSIGSNQQLIDNDTRWPAEHEPNGIGDVIRGQQGGILKRTHKRSHDFRPDVGGDLPALRRFRAQLQAWLADRSVALTIPEHLLAVSLLEGQSVYRANQSGGGGIIALACMEILLDSRTDGSPRLKVCANPSCGAAFHDNSRNLSRVWHDVKTCGNQANLRASRARKRESQEG